MISNSFHMSTRSGHRASAPSLSSSVTPSDGQGKRRRRRGKRGGKKRKHRAGVRRNQLKSERLAKSHLRVMYWNCRSLEQRGVVAEKLAYSCDILCLQEQCVQFSSNSRKILEFWLLDDFPRILVYLRGSSRKFDSGSNSADL